MTEKETYLYLDLNGKLDINYFQNNKIFFKMINLDKKPMVQIGNYVFEGKYDDYLGTKVFFIENEDYKPSDNIFERQSSNGIHLKYFTKTGKVLQLKSKSVPISSAEELTNNEFMNLRFNETYNTVLEKFEKAELNINDISVKSTEIKEKIQVEEEENTINEEKVEDKVDIDEAMEVELIPEANYVDFTKHEIFKEYNRLPKKQIEQQKLYEIKDEHLVKVTNAKDYPVVKQLFLENISFEDIDTSSDDFSKYIDMEKSINDGVISEIEKDNLTNELKEKLLHSDNFINFTLPMKMAYLLLQLDYHKKFIEENRNKDVLKEVDQFGRTPKDKYRFLKQLIKDLWYIIYLDKA